MDHIYDITEQTEALRSSHSRLIPTTSEDSLCLANILSYLDEKDLVDSILEENSKETDFLKKILRVRSDFERSRNALVTSLSADAPNADLSEVCIDPLRQDISDTRRVPRNVGPMCIFWRCPHC